MLYLIFSVLHVGFCTSCSKNELEVGPEWRELTSPFWPEAIHPKIECEWKLTAPPGKRVQIHFEEINLAETIDPDGHCDQQLIDLIDGGRISETENDYVSFCGTAIPSIDFITKSEVARVWLKSNISPELATGEEKYKLKFKFTEDAPNVQDYISGTVRTEKSGYTRRSPVKLRSLRQKTNTILAGDYTDYGDEVLRTTGTGGRVRSRVSIGEYNPDKVINARPTLNSPRADFTPERDIEASIMEGGGKLMASIAFGALGLFLSAVVLSVCCWNKYAKDPSVTGTGPMVYCASTHRYITVNT